VDPIDVPLFGSVEPGFEPVRDAFLANFTELGDEGAGVCVYLDGVKVVDLTGGWSWRKRGVAYDPDTLQLVFSTTKGATAICAHILADRGLLDLQAPVSQYWPEFAQAGKRGIRVDELLSHRAGLPTIDATMKLEEVLAWDPIVDALAAQKPYWEPGTAHGYHALTFGWLVGEVVRRVSGKTVGTFFAEEVAAPLGLRFWIGLPADYEPKVSRLRIGQIPSLAEIAQGKLPPEIVELASQIFAPGSLLLRALTLNGAFGEFLGSGGPFNQPSVHAAEIPAANGITDAASLARMYAATIGTVDGVRLISEEALGMATKTFSEGQDRVLMTPSRFGLGFMLDMAEFAPMLSPASFGHTGAGGSMGFADPDLGISFGYVMKQMRMGLGVDERAARLIAAIRSCLD